MLTMGITQSRTSPKMPDFLLGAILALFVATMLGLVVVGLVIIPLWMADLIL